MGESTASGEDYPQELLDAHYIEDGVHHVPAHDVIEALEEMLRKKDILPSEPENQSLKTHTARILTMDDYIRGRSQEELYNELRTQDDPSISSAAKHLDPQWTPRTKSTYEFIQLYTSTIANFESMQ
jgi:hypothetical protein